MFGAMFAPKPFDVAREMVRVARPGGRIIMGNWIPNDPTLVAHFGVAGIASEAISWERDSYVFDFKGSPAEFVDTFRQYYGPTMNAFDAASKEGRTDALRSDLVALFQSQNQSQYPNTTLVSATFLRVTVEAG